MATRTQLEVRSQGRRARFIGAVLKLAQEHDISEVEVAYALIEEGNRLQYLMMAEVWRNDAGEVDE